MVQFCNPIESPPRLRFGLRISEVKEEELEQFELCQLAQPQPRLFRVRHGAHGEQEEGQVRRDAGRPRVGEAVEEQDGEVRAPAHLQEARHRLLCQDRHRAEPTWPPGMGLFVEFI